MFVKYVTFFPLESVGVCIGTISSVGSELEHCKHAMLLDSVRIAATCMKHHRDLQTICAATGLTHWP